MSSRLGIGLAWGFFASVIAWCETPELPTHPHRLQFSEERIRLPTVTGRRIQLTSGPVVFLAEDHSLPLVEISLALPVGSFLDPSEGVGLSYLTATQIRRGGAGDLDADRFDDRADFLGVRLHTMSGSTRSGATLSVPSWALTDGLDLLFAMLTQPSFQQDRLAVSRSNLLESLTRRNEDPLEVLEREWAWLMVGEDHFTTRLMTGASLENLDRRSLVEFHRDHWRPDRMVLAVSGDFHRQTLLSSLESRFIAWPRPDRNESPSGWPPPAPQATAPPGLYHYEMDTPQAKVVLGHRLDRALAWSDPDRWTLAVLGEILGGRGAISRIAGRLRTAEGLVYRTSTEVHPGELWPGELKIFFESRGESVVRAITSTIEELERIRSEGVHPTELSVVEQTLLARLRLDFDTAEEIAGYFAEDELLDRSPSYWQGYMEGIGGVTIAEVQEAAIEYLQPTSLLFLVVGRWQEISPTGSPGRSPLEKLVGHHKTSLKSRDPITLETRPVP